jgi:hypothetical protein
MRYYLYISDKKVDMLFPQVPGASKKKIAAKLGFNVKLLSGSLSTERSTYDSRVAKLEAVAEYILSSQAVGSPERPDVWIKGVVQARTVSLGQDAILLIATDPSWILALGGSSRHLTGSQAKDITVPLSFAPELLRALKLIVEHPEFLNHPEELLRLELSAGVKQPETPWAELIIESLRLAAGPTQRIEFVPKRLLSDEYSALPCGAQLLARRLVSDEKSSACPRVTLATPLYVTLKD